MANILTDTQKQTLSGYGYWVNLTTILGFITAGFLILMGLPLLFVLGLGVIYIALGAMYIWLASKVRKTGKIAKSMSEAADLSQTEAVDKAIESFEHLRVVTKVMGIMAIIQFAFSALAVLALAGGLFTAIQNGEFDFDYDTDENTSDVINTEGTVDQDEFDEIFKSLTEDIEN